jgi:hypothetical protein
MSYPGRYILVVAAGLFFLGYVVSVSVHTKAKAPLLSITFQGWTNNPVRSPPPNRLELARGATGRCALFWVTNAEPFDHTLWFDSFEVEQNTNGQWLAFTRTNSLWSGVEGSVWWGGYGCMYAVGWPPGLPTNATWRLRIRCGRDLSPIKLRINEKLRRKIFHPDQKHMVLWSSEVIP